MDDRAERPRSRDATKAMFWLGQSRDPRVTAFLADIITAEASHEQDFLLSESLIAQEALCRRRHLPR